MPLCRLVLPLDNTIHKNANRAAVLANRSVASPQEATRSIPGRYGNIHVITVEFTPNNQIQVVVFVSTPILREVRNDLQPVAFRAEPRIRNMRTREAHGIIGDLKPNDLATQIHSDRDRTVLRAVFAYR